jgi:pimeloyl-ACP methyl ester carboxylesterase
MAFLKIDSAGSGAPCLIFVHGGFCDRHDWDAQVTAFASRHRVIAFDMPGHGESQLPAEPTVAALGEALCEVKDRYGGGNVVLIGHSLGVDIVLEAYRQCPASIAGLLLIEGGLVADGDPERAANAVAERMDAVGLDAFLRGAFSQMFTSTSNAKLRERVLGRLERLDRSFAREIIHSKVRWDASVAASVLASVTTPVRLIQSTYFDETFERRSLKGGMTTPWTALVSRQVPHADVCYVEATGHFPHIEAAEIVNEQIRAFLDQLGGTV